MKALVWTQPNRMEIQEAEQPMPSSGEVLINVMAAGICGSELSGYLGENSLRIPPLIMGHEFTGVVKEVGVGVDDSLINKQVIVNPLISCKNCYFCKRGYDNLCENFSIVGIHQQGAFAEWISVPAEACYPVDRSFGELEGTFVEPLACSLRAICLGQVGLLDKVLIMGAGFIGLSALKVALEAGASEVIVADTNEDRLSLAGEWGATELINPKDGNLVSKCLSISNDIGVDVVIDAVGLPDTRQNAMEVVRKGGNLVFVGLHHDETTIAGNVLVRSEINIKGSFTYTRGDFENALELMKSGLISSKGEWIDVRGFEEGDQSFKELVNGSPFSKIILKP